MSRSSFSIEKQNPMFIYFPIAINSWKRNNKGQCATHMCVHCVYILSCIAEKWR